MAKIKFTFKQKLIASAIFYYRKSFVIYWITFLTSKDKYKSLGLLNLNHITPSTKYVKELYYFQITEPITTHVALILVAIVLGLVGGILGAVFTLCNTQIVCPARDAVLSKARNPFLKKVLKILECLIIVVSIDYTSSVSLLAHSTDKCSFRSTNIRSSSVT